MEVDSPHVRYTADAIEADYLYETTEAARTPGGGVRVVPTATKMTFRTQRKVPRLGLMLVGWGGNNGSTVTATILANRLGIEWRTKEGRRRPNYFGSITQASTVCVGTTADGEQVHLPLGKACI